jgi:AcrR family transcriptional regulator
VGLDGRMGSAAKRMTGLAQKRNVAQRKERASYSAKRDKIVKAAGPVLMKYGLGGTTIEAIAKEAGVDRATIYYYFSDKGAIFREAIHGGLTEMVAALEQVAASATTRSCTSSSVRIRPQSSTTTSTGRSSLPVGATRTWLTRPSVTVSSRECFRRRCRRRSSPRR